ncbi:MAG: PEP-CTERM sorting domain-containing protein [Rhodobacterales bacterium]|nr:PEP-CTERM sorting domain-containing protein [Rhodobacterales bacterium]
MHRHPWRAGALAAGVFLALSSAAQAIPVQYDLTFETSGQSLWDTGTAVTLDKTQFLGAAWQDKSVGLDLITGSDDTTLPNPAWLTYQAALGTCTTLGNSTSDCINGRQGQAPVPKLGKRPSIRSCGRFAVGCKIAQAGDYTRRAAYDVAMAACRATGVSRSTCENGRSLVIPLPALGEAPPSTLDVNTKTGVAVNGSTDGRVGLELGLTMDSGSVDAVVSYQASLDIPDTAGLDKATPINFNPASVLAGTNSLNTTFSNVALSVDAIMELTGAVTAEGCVIAAGCAVAGGPFDIAERASVLTFNEDGTGGVELLGHEPSFYGLPDTLDGFPFSVDIAGLAEITLHQSRPDASGGLDATSQTLKATGQDDFLDLILDVDNIVATAAGVPGLFGEAFDVGPGSVFYDIINVAMGPTIDLQQDFELDPTLFVHFAFDQEVMVDGLLVSELISPWDELPDILFQADVTNVTPTFFLEASLLNQTLLDFDMEFFIDLLQIGFDFPLVGEHAFGIGNVLAQGVDLFDSPALFANLFPLGGWQLEVGDSFQINFLSGSSGPASTDTRSESNAVPEPGVVVLLLLGLAGVMVARRRRAAPVLSA